MECQHHTRASTQNRVTPDIVARGICISFQTAADSYIHGTICTCTFVVLCWFLSDAESRKNMLLQVQLSLVWSFAIRSTPAFPATPALLAASVLIPWQRRGFARWSNMRLKRSQSQLEWSYFRLWAGPNAVRQAAPGIFRDVGFFAREPAERPIFEVFPAQDEPVRLSWLRTVII